MIQIKQYKILRDAIIVSNPNPNLPHTLSNNDGFLSNLRSKHCHSWVDCVDLALPIHHWQKSCVKLRIWLKYLLELNVMGNKRKWTQLTNHSIYQPLSFRIFLGWCMWSGNIDKSMSWTWPLCPGRFCYCSSSTNFETPNKTIIIMDIG